MSKKQVFFLLFLTFVMGLIADPLSRQAKQVLKEYFTKQPSELKSLAGLSNEEFLKAYREKRDLLSPEERAIGDRLYASLEEKQKPEPQPESPKPVLPKPAHTKIFVDEAPEAKYPEGAFLYHQNSRQNFPPAQIQGSALVRMFPNDEKKKINAENFGVELNAIGNVDDYLKNHVCVDPNFVAITEARKDQSKFFDFVKNDSYKGKTSVHLGSKKNILDSKFLFNSTAYDGSDYTETVDDKKNYLEKRIISSEKADAAWRYNTCKSSVSLLSDRCAWNDRYTQEFKDFYVSPDSKKMVGNVYCKNPAEPHWTHLGNIELSQMADDNE